MDYREKSIELVDKYYMLDLEMDTGIIGVNIELAKQCALIAVDEIIEVTPLEPNTNREDWEINIDEASKYWINVKKAIEEM